MLSRDGSPVYRLGEVVDHFSFRPVQAFLRAECAAGLVDARGRDGHEAARHHLAHAAAVQPAEGTSRARTLCFGDTCSRERRWRRIRTSGSSRCPRDRGKTRGLRSIPRSHRFHPSRRYPRSPTRAPASARARACAFPPSRSTAMPATCRERFVAPVKVTSSRSSPPIARPRPRLPPPPPPLPERAARRTPRASPRRRPGP